MVSMGGKIILDKNKKAARESKKQEGKEITGTSNTTNNEMTITVTV